MFIANNLARMATNGIAKGILRAPECSLSIFLALGHTKNAKKVFDLLCPVAYTPFFVFLCLPRPIKGVIGMDKPLKSSQLLPN